MSYQVPSQLTTLTIEEMADILGIKPRTMHDRKWQTRTGCPLKKVGRRLLAFEWEFQGWLSDKKKLSV